MAFMERFRTAYKLAKQMEQKSITPMGTLPSSQNMRPVWKDWSTENAVHHGFKASTWVYSCISRIAKTGSSVPWKVYRRTGAELEEAPDHPLQELLEQPNPYISGQDLIERMIIHLHLGGNALVSKVRANNIVAELWPVSPDRISPVPSQQEFISHYEYNYLGRRTTIDPQDIMHIMFIDPSNVYWGMAPLQAVARSVDTDNEMLDWQKVSLQNRAITDGVFSFKQPLTTEQWREAREMVKEQHMGSGTARTPWVLGSEAEWQQMSLTPAEMDFIESRNFTREEICSVFNVPPPMIGLYDNATLSNIETARKIFWLDTMIPLLEDLKSTLNQALVPEFEEGIYIDYDVSNVQAIQDNYTEKVETAQTLWSMGIPFNEINQRLQLGFDEIEGGDIGYLPLNLVGNGGGFGGNENVNVNDDGNPNQNAYVPVTHRKNKSASTPREKAWNLETEEQKEMYWKNLEQRREGWVEQFSKRIENLFEEEAELVAEAFEKGGIEEAFSQIDDRADKWEQVNRTMLQNIIEDFGEQTWDTLKAQKPPRRKDFDPWSENIQRWVQTRVAQQVVNVLDTTKDLIRNVIAVGMDEGQGVDQIARNIQERYNGFSKYRAETIARTETVASSNYGSVESAKQTGLDPMKVWVSSRDSRVRDTHMDIDGTMVGMDEEFIVGGDSMLFPAGGSDPAENVNCRCTVSYRVVR